MARLPASRRRVRPRPKRTAPSGGFAAETWELVIEAVGARGDGVTGGLFAPLTLAGERVRARVDGERAELIEVIEASRERIAPACVHFGDCGGCALQHWGGSPYLAWKADQIRQALARARLETEILAPFAAAPGARRRLALHARRIGGEVVLGFKAARSWRVVSITECAVADPRLVAAMPGLAAMAGPFLEHPDSAPTLRVTLTLTGLDIDVTGVEAKSGGLSADARQRAARLAAALDVARVTLAGEILYQARLPVVAMGSVKVALPPGAFLQAVPAAEEAMAAFAVEAAGGARRIADLYCGVGAFTFPLAAIAPVIAADVSAPAVEALARAAGSAPGLKSISASARDLDRRPLLAHDLTGIDLVLFDPPRAGAAAQAREIAASDCARVIAVSCNPATFARDARLLVDGGYRLERVLPVDQFLWSPHIELVGVFSRNGH
ncbi:MAG TPA: RNA methyltransferase [Caulobacteraceae bacterium]|jgi:23S rRNA (uracil1939-C5)-methyltransferase